ncbi:unnamed protein product [Pleuronectes platessa]|uniref:Uncharacterized protein n=1 Tax=Pleuronectes platessa TaxID=8262 RepID=A0A9N7YWT4_PLEPL|nr:unnamed protein product [Pleuronectes platessa]
MPPGHLFAASQAERCEKLLQYFRLIDGLVHKGCWKEAQWFAAAHHAPANLHLQFPFKTPEDQSRRRILSSKGDSHVTLMQSDRAEWVLTLTAQSHLEAFPAVSEALTLPRRLQAEISKPLPPHINDQTECTSPHICRHACTSSASFVLSLSSPLRAPARPLLQMFPSRHLLVHLLVHLLLCSPHPSTSQLARVTGFPMLQHRPRSTDHKLLTGAKLPQQYNLIRPALRLNSLQLFAVTGISGTGGEMRVSDLGTAVVCV